MRKSTLSPNGNGEMTQKGKGEISKHEAARRFKAALDTTGESRYKLAKLLDLTRGRLSEYENLDPEKCRLPSWTRMLWMVKKLGLDPAVIYPEIVGKKSKKKP
jgi:transcriptional regulator with XRE-family HTH domain